VTGNPFDETAASLARVTEERDKARRHVKALEAEVKANQRTAERLAKELGLLDALTERPIAPHRVVAHTPSSAKNVTAVLLVSDLHLDEVVFGPEVEWSNRYDRAIAVQRVERLAVGAEKLAKHYLAGMKYDGLLMPLLGDNFSGSIHEELVETNEDTMLGSLDFWLDPLAGLIEHMADAFGKVTIPVVVGNHGRSTRKPRSKHRARDNFDWFLGKALERHFRADPRVTFIVAESADQLVTVYDKTICCTHGDQATGGSGIGGIWPPIMRLDARKGAAKAAVNTPYDLMVMGHWHQLIFGQRFVINGSLKGYDEYAVTNSFVYEEARQAMFVMAPERGVTFRSDVHVTDPTAEGWAAARRRHQRTVKAPT
jgi:hypothetical protein